LSLAARALLIKTCLASIPIYLLSFIKFPKWAIQILNSQMGNCLWNDTEDAHKYHLANWGSVSLCKEFGGLGIPNLRDLNVCLLASWIKRYDKDRDKLWTEMLDFKYRTKSPNIFQTNTRGASPSLGVSCGQHKQPEWVIDGLLEMGRKSGFGRITG
jgi:hypothetical protein